MKKLLPAFALAALLLPACEKDNVGPDGLVKATQEGKNTGDFLVDGVAFTPRPRVSSPGSSPVGGFRSLVNNKNIQISFFRENDGGSAKYLSININNIKSAGLYQFNDAVSPYVVAGSNSYIVFVIPAPYPILRKHYITGPTALGRVEVTRYDTIAHIISGTFDAHLREYNNGSDTLHITKGRFDCTF